MQVPQPVKQLFDHFPLKTYPPVPQLASDEKQQIEHRLFSYSASASTSSSQFKLGVYNVIQMTDKTTYIATDPLCLAAELSLSLQNDIKLPKINNKHHLANNSLFLLSHHSNKQAQLPIYIEQDPRSKSKRIVRDHQSMNELYCSRVESSSELMLITLADCVLYDIWTATVLLDLAPEKQSEIYQFSDGSEGAALTNRWALSSLLTQLCFRNGFNWRNRNITEKFESGIFTRTSKSAIAKEKSRIRAEFVKIIEDLNHVLVQKDTDFFNGEGPGLLDVKVASYLILIDKFLAGHDTCDVVNKYPALKAHSQAVLKVCV
jgi:sorting and assembly machinery component 35